MKRLAIVRQKYNPAGGAERIVSAVIRQLAGSDWLRPVLVNRRWEALDGVEAVQVDPFYLGSVWRDWSFARAARRAWQALGAELVQSHERIPGCHVYRADDGVHEAWLATRVEQGGWRARLAIACNPYHHYMRRSEQAMYRHPDFRGVICISDMVKQDVMRYTGLPESRCFVIHNGIDSVYFNPEDARAGRADMRAALGLAADAPVLAYVGSGFARKGVAQALRALVPHAAVHLVVVGGDKHQDRYRQLAVELGVADRVIFVGSQSDVRSYYGMADGFILPSVYEPFGLVVAEAMACGLPVLTSTRCGAGELLRSGRTGWLARPGDDAAWQALVGDWLAARPRWPEMGREARDAVLPLTESAMVGRMLEVYGRLLAA
ncbi:glycosyltransferase family 4 protein [Chromobacterium alticapitis]|uniref:Glycosyl transferase family 1 n=1 Tax=Chromobacterium alticapitis TaxID=2073169 RepID=A0A2S5DCJ5_9NEIS|nr:glycosyltransferase family 4 protein [Chromobacterium alticapitis]POZ60748.1 glycosyl transferase family 1 [Chromobacterium alticapitis]